MVGVGGSNPLASTSFMKKAQNTGYLALFIVIAIKNIGFFSDFAAFNRGSY